MILLNILIYFDKQELESDEEWSNLLEITDQELKLQQQGEEIEDPVLERVVQNSDFLGKMSVGFHSAADEVVKGILEGASKFRQILKVFRNILLLPRLVDGSIRDDLSSCSNIGSMRDDFYWTSRKNSLELIELSFINKVSLV